MSFFSKFPEFINHDLYLAGESYAGIYVPYLALKMDEWNRNDNNPYPIKFNLKGFIVGNGVTNWKWDGDPAFIKMGYHFNLIGNDIHNRINKY